MQRQRYYNRTCTCEWCERVFHASRYDAKYCSDGCRKQASREPARLRRAELHARESVLAYLRMLKSDEEYQHAIERFQSFIAVNSLVRK